MCVCVMAAAERQQVTRASPHARRKCSQVRRVVEEFQRDVALYLLSLVAAEYERGRGIAVLLSASPLIV